MPVGGQSLYHRIARRADSHGPNVRTNVTKARETVDADADHALIYQATTLLAAVDRSGRHNALVRG
jgi:hypothetical protein